MERRVFIHLTASAAVGSFAQMMLPSAIAQPINWYHPLSSLSAIPPAIGNVRHGLFQMRPMQPLLLPEWITLFEPQRLYKNGISASPDDLFSFCFKSAGKTVSVCYSSNDCFLVGDSVEDISEGQASVANTSIYKGVTEIAIEAKSENVLFVLRGKAKVGDEKLVQGEFIALNESRNLATSATDALVVVVARS